MFVAFDGIDGVGKSTQVRRLADALEARGERVHCLSFGQMPQTRDLLRLAKEERGIDPRIRELVYYADGLFRNARIAAIDPNEWVIVDRFYLTYRTYGPLNGWTPEEVRVLTASLLEPELYVVLRLSPLVAAQRIRSRGGFVPAEVNYDFDVASSDDAVAAFAEHQARACALLEANIGPNHVVIDADQSEDAIHEEVLRNALEARARAGPRLRPPA